MLSGATETRRASRMHREGVAADFRAWRCAQWRSKRDGSRAERWAAEVAPMCLRWDRVHSTRPKRGRRRRTRPNAAPPTCPMARLPAFRSPSLRVDSFVPRSVPMPIRYPPGANTPQERARSTRMQVTEPTSSDTASSGFLCEEPVATMRVPRARRTSDALRRRATRNYSRCDVPSRR
jgi:hypothetical protein